MRRGASRLARLTVAVLAGAAAAGCSLVGQGEAATPLVAFDPALHARLPQEVREAGELVLATDPSYAPASAFGPDGRTIVGFEPDLAAELGRVLGVRTRFVAAPFTDVLTEVADGEVDLAISAITDTADREQVVDFVTYFTAGTSVLVRRGNPAAVGSLSDLCGLAVAVEQGTVQVDLLARTQQRCGEDEAIRVRQTPDNADALLRLRTGRVDAVLSDYPPAALLTADPATSALYQLASDTQHEPGLYGIAVAKDRPALRDAVHGALEKVISRGAYADVLERWGVGAGAVPAASLNAASVGPPAAAPPRAPNG